MPHPCSLNLTDSLAALSNAMSHPVDTHHTAQSQDGQLGRPWTSPHAASQPLPRISRRGVSSQPQAPPTPATEGPRGSKRTRREIDAETPATGATESIFVVEDGKSRKKPRKVAQEPPSLTSTTERRKPRKLSATAPGFPASMQTPLAAPSSAQSSVLTSAPVMSRLPHQHRPVEPGHMALPQIPAVPRLAAASSPAVPTITITPTPEPSAAPSQRHRRNGSGSQHGIGMVAATRRALRPRARRSQNVPTKAALADATAHAVRSPSSLPTIPYNRLWAHLPSKDPLSLLALLNYLVPALQEIRASLCKQDAPSREVLADIVNDRPSRAPSSAQAPSNAGLVCPRWKRALPGGVNMSAPVNDAELENAWSRNYGFERQTVDSAPSPASGSSHLSPSSFSAPPTPSSSSSRGASSGAADPRVPSFENPSRAVTDTSLPVGVRYQLAPPQQLPVQGAVRNVPSRARPSSVCAAPTATQPVNSRSISISQPASSTRNVVNGHGMQPTTVESPLEEPPFVAPLLPSTYTGRDPLLGLSLPQSVTGDAHLSVLVSNATVVGVDAPQALYGELPSDVFATSSELMATFSESPLVDALEWMSNGLGGYGGYLGAGFEHDFSSESGFIYDSPPYDNSNL
ncbi:hypothetical protein GY45DRAFT_327075 [Cubamyces sp. BRFM 1775]|nr:hypothetical protein GY45DRAFT_327075 [Cubamyces sp. BRFM 1775]